MQCAGRCREAGTVCSVQGGTERLAQCAERLGRYREAGAAPLQVAWQQLRGYSRSPGNARARL